MAAGRQALPRAVWALGLVSLLMDVASEMIHGLLPLFLTSVLGASALTVGMVEGLGEGTALFARVFSGYWSDRLARRKPFAVAGYALGALSKPLFAMAGGVGMVLTARTVDRFGKGIRGAPRDALVADVTPAAQRGAAYGLRQSLDSVGAVLGPGLAIFLMWLSHDHFRFVFWFAFLPGLGAVLLLAFAVREPEHTAQPSDRRFARDALRGLGRPFWLVAAVGVVFTLARFSEAFLMLRAAGLGLAVGDTPLVLMVLSLTYALGAYPVGHWSDRIGRWGLLGAGLIMLILADLVLARADSVALALTGAAMWGLHMALTQGIFSALVADSVGAELRGTAFGAFGLLSGVAVILASLLAGELWETLGPAATFLVGAGFAALALTGLALLRRA